MNAGNGAETNPGEPGRPAGVEIPDTSPPRIDRRTALRWMLTAYATLAVLPPGTWGQPAVAAAAAAKGYGTDPDLTKHYNPGDLWPLTLTPDQRRTVVALCDAIIPADANSPAASAVGVPDFIDEWISAPYDANVHDRALILNGLAWLETEAGKRFGGRFDAVTDAQRAAICEDICLEATARPEFKQAAQFFARFRDLTAGGFYTTPEGMKDVGYTGNVPLPAFDGPPAELIRRLGLA